MTQFVAFTPPFEKSPTQGEVLERGVGPAPYPDLPCANTFLIISAGLGEGVWEEVVQQWEGPGRMFNDMDDVTGAWLLVCDCKQRGHAEHEV